VSRETGDTGGAPYAKRKIMTAPQSASRKPKQLEAGSFQPEISSFRLHLAAEGKAAKTVRTYTEAVQWFAGEHLRREAGLTSWEEVGKPDIQRDLTLEIIETGSPAQHHQNPEPETRGPENVG
jgi:hypothetical protein